MSFTKAFEDLFKSFYELIASIFSTFYHILQAFLNAIINFFTGIVNLTADVFSGVVDVVGGVGKFVLGKFPADCRGAVSDIAPLHTPGANHNHVCRQHCHHRHHRRQRLRLHQVHGTRKTGCGWKEDGLNICIIRRTCLVLIREGTKLWRGAGNDAHGIDWLNAGDCDLTFQRR